MRPTDPSSVKEFLKARLPEKAFRATPSLLLVPLLHTTVVLACILAIAATSNYFYIVLLSVIAGHSMFCIANFGHYLSHKAIIRNSTFSYISEVFVWATNMSSATVWTRAHNTYHHKYTNGTSDTFRAFSKNELTPIRKLVALLVYPSKYTRYSPLAFLIYLITHAEYMNAALTNRTGTKSHIVPHLATYKSGDKAKIYFELLVIVSLQVGIYFLIGEDLGKHLLFAGLSIFTSSAVASSYLFTQHNLYSLSDINDPLRNSTSVIVPKFIDTIHLNVSHHVEHHIFGGMSPTYLPLVRKLLQEHYHDLYMCVRFRDIWGEIFSGEPHKEFGDGRIVSALEIEQLARVADDN